MNTINDRIKELRKALNLTMETFGTAIGVTRSAISGFEKGITNPSEQTLRLICMEFNVNETWLRVGEGKMFRETTREQLIVEYVADLATDHSEDRDFEKRFFRAMASLNKEQWLVVQEIVDKMIEDNEKS